MEGIGQYKLRIY